MFRKTACFVIAALCLFLAVNSTQADDVMEEEEEAAFCMANPDSSRCSDDDLVELNENEVPGGAFGKQTKKKKGKRCLHYDPATFKTHQSVVTYFPNGRLGNMISAFLYMFWIKLDFGADVYLERDAFDHLDRFFEGIDAVKVLEDDLCDWTKFPFQKYEGNIEELERPHWATGKAIQLYIDKKNFLRHEIQGGRKYFKQFRKETVDGALRFREKFRRHANRKLSEVVKMYNDRRRNNGEKAVKASEVTFVGVHNRRTDYLEFRRKRLGLEDLREDYFIDAMDYFQEDDDSYPNPVFLYVSDDAEWGRDGPLNDADSLFFVGCGDGDDNDCIGRDLAVLAACNHTVTTHGTFGHWASYLAGGEIYTEYGAIVPDAYN